jgi:hypothetical protein
MTDIPAPTLGTIIKMLLVMLSTDQDNIALTSRDMIRNKLASEGADIHDLVGCLSSNGGGQLLQAEMEKIYTAGIEEGRRQAEAQSPITLHSVGEPTWHEIATACAAHPEVFKSENERQFVADMIRRTVCNGAPSEKQAAWLRKIYARFI